MCTRPTHAGIRSVEHEHGRGLMSMVRELRVGHVRSLLRSDPARSHAVIAAASGFATERHFYRVFRQRTGLTPREYRAAGSGTIGHGMRRPRAAQWKRPRKAAEGVVRASPHPGRRTKPSRRSAGPPSLPIGPRRAIRRTLPPTAGRGEVLRAAPPTVSCSSDGGSGHCPHDGGRTALQFNAGKTSARGTIDSAHDRTQRTFRVCRRIINRSRPHRLGISRGRHRSTQQRHRDRLRGVGHRDAEPDQHRPARRHRAVHTHGRR
ncbi:helix-turn-helix domain-containing protein [Nocardia blacklockiae]|uniref:helix-turn-helix domain-containing protein n=1 Tax=Nocardia blacklockiae TaxID=480036 RepID=UPI0034DD2D6C